MKRDMNAVFLHYCPFIETIAAARHSPLRRDERLSAAYLGFLYAYHTYQPGLSSFEMYLEACVREAILEEAKKQNRITGGCSRLSLNRSLGNCTVLDVYFSGSADDVESTVLLRDMLSRLEPEQYQLAKLYMNKYSFWEVTDELGLSAAELNWRNKKLRQALKAYLE